MVGDVQAATVWISGWAPTRRTHTFICPTTTTWFGSEFSLTWAGPKWLG